MLGRRIYVHSHSLKQLCVRNHDACTNIMGSLVSVSFKKILFKYLYKDGQKFGYLSKPQSADLLNEINQVSRHTISSALSKVVVLKGNNAKEQLAEKLLKSKEEIEASCFDDNYYTFATCDESAKKMFADEIPFSELRKKLQNCPNDITVNDLTLIKGNCLSWNSNGLPDLKLAQAYVGNKTTMSTDKFEKLGASIINSAKSQINTIFEATSLNNLPPEFVIKARGNISETLNNSLRPLNIAGIRV